MYKLVILASIMGLTQAASTPESSPAAVINASAPQEISQEAVAGNLLSPSDKTDKPVINRFVANEWDECERLGLLRPLSVQQVEALPAELGLRQANAMKVVMLMRYAINRDNSYRLTKENLEECAQLAQKLGAPKPFILAYALEATGNVSARKRYFIRRIVSLSLLSHRINQDRIRVFAEMNKLHAGDLKKLIDDSELPLEQSFEFPTQIADLDAAKVNERVALYAEKLQKLTLDIAAISDRKAADLLPSAQLETLPMLKFFSLLESGLYTEFVELMTKSQKQVIADSIRDLSLQIMRLNEFGFYESKKLQVFIDLLRY